MCGICGIVTDRPNSDAEPARRMNQALIHRGPDGEGEYNSAHISMAMRRLSIIDLNSGWQPLYNEERTIAVIANGEIYNYIELRDELQKHGHRFSTKSDIETIAHLYEEYGLDCVKYLRGMFAFALWDKNRQRLVLARDRMGEKPLYLYETKDEIFFASEMKSLLRCGQIDFAFDPVAIDLYFHYQYVPEPLTPLQEVRKLPAGHLLIVDVDPWRVEQHAYWRMQDAPPVEGDPIKLIRAQLEEVSTLVVRSDVPVGVALSGGIDSSAVAALAARTYPGVLQAFSVGYPGRPPNDERKQAKAFADLLKIPFHEVELPVDEQTDFFEELVYLRDDPIADISGFGYYSVSQKARELGVPVLLQGQGGDELFWGYEWVRQAALQTIRKQTARRADGDLSVWPYLKPTGPAVFRPRALFEWGKSFFGLRQAGQDWKRDQLAPRDEMVFMNLTPDFFAAHSVMSTYYSRGFCEQLLGSFPERLYTFEQPWPDIPVTLTSLITQTYLLENGIAQGDRLGMANSVELRLPLVDYKLVETVIGLRKNYPDHKLHAKFWLKQALRGTLPDELLNRPKQGFAPPVHEWHQHLFQKYGALLKDGALVEAGVLTSAAGRALSEGPFPPGVSPVSFKALVLELWTRRMRTSFA